MAASSAPPRDAPRVDGPPVVRRVSDAVVVVGVALAFVVIVVLPTTVADGGNRSTRPSLVAPETSEPMRRAESWLEDNLRGDSRVVIDDLAADELVGRGLTDEQVIGIGPFASLDDAPRRWESSQFLVVSPDLRSRIDSLPEVRAVVDSWVPVAAFGEGDDRVEIRTIASGSTGDLHERDIAAQALRLRGGSELADNPRVSASPDAIVALRSGRVDERLLSVLATFSVSHELHIDAFPTVEAEDGVGAPLRMVEIDRVDDGPVSVDGSGLSPIEAFLDAQRQAYRPMSVTSTPGPSGDAVLRVVYPVAASAAGG